MANANKGSPAQAQTRITTSEEKINIWAVGPGRVIAALFGILLYGLLSHTNIVVLLPAGSLDVFLPALIIPLLFGALYGPWVGLLTGGIGFLIGDYLANTWFSVLRWDNGYFFYGSSILNFRDLIGWNGLPGYIANALIGFAAGLSLLSTRRRFNTLYALASLGVIGAIGVASGIGIIVYSAVWVYQSPYYGPGEATSALIDSALPNLIFALVVAPLLLCAHDAIAWRRRRTPSK